MKTLKETIDNTIKKHIEILAELKLMTYATVQSYTTTLTNLYGIIKYDKLNGVNKIGFKYNIYKDKLTLMTIDEMAKEAYYMICKN